MSTVDQTSHAQAERAIAKAKCWEMAVQLYNLEMSQGSPIDLTKCETDSVAFPFCTVQDLLVATNKVAHELYGRKGRRGKWCDKVSIAVQDIRQYAPILDVFTQGQQGAVSLCWGMTRVILEVVGRCLEFGGEVLRNIGRFLRQLSIFEEQLSYLASTQQSICLIARLYACLLDYLRRASLECARSRLKRIRYSLNGKLASIVQEIDRLSAEVHRQVTAETASSVSRLAAAHARTWNEARSDRKVDDAKQDQRQQRTLCVVEERADILSTQILTVGNQVQLQASIQGIHSWLRADAVFTAPSAAVADGTCRWIFEHNVYEKWKRGGSDTPLWICGRSGVGKSTMSFALSQHFSQTGYSVIPTCIMQTYAESSYAVPQLLLDIALNALQRSAMVRHSKFAEMLREAVNFRLMCEGPAVQQGIPRLISFVHSLIRLLPELILIVDDLHLLICDDDDPESRTTADVKSLLLWLKEISHQPKTSVLIFSCHRRWLQNSLNWDERIQISADMTNTDIAIVVQQWLKTHPEWEKFADHIESMILEKAEANFEWLSLVLEELGGARTRSAADLKRRLSQMPRALHEVYMQKSAIKLQTLSEGEKTSRERILRIMAAANRPMPIDCINEGSSFDPLQHVFVNDDRFFTPAKSIQEICEPFLEVDEGFVYFRHESARLCVRKEVVNITDANSFLLDICLSKLIEEPFRQLGYCARLLENNLLIQMSNNCAKSVFAGESGLYTHAALHWHEYAIALQELTQVLWDKLCTLLNSNAFVSWSENLYILKQRNGLNAQFNVGTTIANWYANLRNEDKPDIGIDNYLIAPYESVSDQLRHDESLSTLNFLALIRPGHYLNLSGRTDADFEKALNLKKRVAEGFCKNLGPRDRNTLFARRTYDQELQGFDRHDEALKDYLDILKIQREEAGEDVIDMYETLQWIGVAYQAMTNFDLSRSSLNQAVEGYKRIKGEAAFAYLIVTMFLGFTVEAQGDLEEATRLYGEIYDKWIPNNGNSNPFAAAILTANGSLLRKQGEYARAQEYLFEAFATRIRLFSITNKLTVDSGLQIAVLYRQNGEIELAEGFIKQVRDSKALETSYERKCQVLHIEALLAFDAGGYEQPRNTLTELILQSIEDQRDRNNRELLWVRLNLAEALRAHGQSEEAPNLFDEIVTSIEPSSRRSSFSGWSNISHPSQEVVVDAPRDLEIAERALRLVRDGSVDVAAELLAAENLRWVREKDFWIISGGPKVDTDSMRFALRRVAAGNQESDTAGLAKGKQRAIEDLKMIHES